jgi:hypothetical protein
MWSTWLLLVGRRAAVVMVEANKLAAAAVLGACWRRSQA